MTVFTAEDYPVLEPGTYQATFDRTEESEEAGQFGYWIDWYFTTTTADGDVDVMGRSSLPDRWTRSTKARQWFEAIAGRELAKAETADTAKLKGSAVSLTLDVVTTARGDERNRIVSIRRRAAAAPDAVAAPAAVADPEFEAWKREQATKQAAVAAANAEQPPAPTESPADLAAEAGTA